MGAVELCVTIGVVTAITLIASYYNVSTGLPQYNNIHQQAANNSKRNRVHPGTLFQTIFHFMFS